MPFRLSAYTTTWLRTLVIASLLITNFPLLATATAVAPPETRQTALLAPMAHAQVELPGDTIPMPIPTDVDLVPPPVDAQVTHPLTPTLTAYVKLSLDRLVLTPGETATVSLLVYRTAEPGGDYTLNLVLPAGLITTEGQAGLLQ